MQKKWEKVYKEYKHYGASLEYLPDIVKIFRRHKIKRALDVGCGGGKHSFYLAKNSFEVYGIDLSEEAIKTARSEFKKQGYRGQFKVCSFAKKFPYKNNFFEAVISIRALNHGAEKEIDNCISEMERVLKPGGLIFVTVQKVNASRFKKTINSLPVKMVSQHSYLPLAGPEKGIAHYIFNKDSLFKKFKKFSN